MTVVRRFLPVSLMTLLAAFPAPDSRAAEQHQESTKANNAADSFGEDQLVDRITADVVAGLRAVEAGASGNDRDSKGVPLVDVVKRLRHYGYASTDVEPAGGSRRGRGGRGRGGAGGRGGHEGAGAHGEGRGGHGAPANEQEMRARYDSFDRNRDGVWTSDEINDYMSGQPASGDGKVTFEEYQQAWEQLRGRRGSGSGSGGHGGTRGSRGRGRSGTGENDGRHGRGRHRHTENGGGGETADRVNADAEFVLALDRNRDRLLTGDEIPAAVAAYVSAQRVATDGVQEQPQDEKTEDVGDAVPPRSDSGGRRGQRRRHNRMLSRAAALRALLVLSESPALAGSTIDATLLEGHVRDKKQRDAIWNAVANGDTTLSADALYRSLLQLDRETIEKIKP